MKGYPVFIVSVIAAVIIVFTALAMYDSRSTKSDFTRMGFHDVHGHGNVYTMRYGSCKVTLLQVGLRDTDEYPWVYRASPDGPLYIIRKADDLRSQPGYENCV